MDGVLLLLREDDVLIHLEYITYKYVSYIPCFIPGGKRRRPAGG